MKSGAELIAEERQRQIGAEGYSPEHDDSHVGDEIANAAVSYATPPRIRAQICLKGDRTQMPWSWPWEHEAWKPSPDDRVRELVKAGALVAAEIDRLQRLGKKDES